MNNQKITNVLIVIYLALFFYIFLSVNEYMDPRQRVAIFNNDKKIKRGGKTSVKFALPPINKKGTVINRKKNIIIDNNMITQSPMMTQSSMMTQSPMITQSPLEIL